MILNLNLKNQFLFIGLFLINFSTLSQSLNWAKRIGGTQSDIGNVIAVDIYGNVYTAGIFSGVVDMDPDTGIQFHSSKSFGAYSDVFITKMNAQGKLLWAKSFGGSYNDIPSDIAVDTKGNVFVTGTFIATVDFDPGAGVFNLVSKSAPTSQLTDIFILKLNSIGEFVWAKQIGGLESDESSSISIDALGNVIIAGNYQDSVDFDPGPGQYFLRANAFNNGMFVSKFDSSGNFKWAKSLSSKGIRSAGWLESMTLDQQGNIYVAGSFYASTDFDPSSKVFILTSAGNGDVYILKLSPAGDFIWVKGFGGINDYYSDDWPIDIKIDNQGNLIIVGYFSGTVDFDPGAGVYELKSTYEGRGPEDIFILKLDSFGDFLWAKSLPVNSFYLISKISIDPWQSIYLTGYFENSIDLDPGPNVFNLTSKGNADIYISKLDATGSFVWGIGIGDIKEDRGISIIANDSGHVYCTGYFSEKPNFDPTSGVFNLTSSGGIDVFIIKLCSPITLKNSIVGVDSVCEGSLVSYEINSKNDAIDYIWNFPTGTIINSGHNSSKINVTFGSESGFIKVSADNGCGNKSYDSVSVSALSQPSITIQPSNKEVFTDSNAVFIVATSCAGCTYQWQENSGTGFINLKNSIKFNGVMNDTLTINLASLTQNNNQYRCVIKNGFCTDTSIISTLKVLELDSRERIEVLPNPASTQLTIIISDLNSFTEYSVVDAMGRVVLSGEIKDKLTSLNISNFSQGIYFINLEGMRNKTFKFIKKE
ncbi:MAG: SBBP repeat-containing protein [Flavobacteriales bacterium]|nr:SBBP repeat-containing protein [Flavobacteriales bacterium]